MIPALRDASEDPALRGSPLAVYVWILHQLEPHAFRPVKLDWVATTLSMKRHTVARALRILTARGYLERGRKDGQSPSYRLLVTRNASRVPLNGHSRELS
jgi:DNA-binding IclR family transcriptional regulator